MPNLNLLIAEPTNWARLVAAWLQEREYAVQIASDWASVKTSLAQHSYDLVLVNDGLWNENIEYFQESIRQNTIFAVLSHTPSKQDFVKVMSLGANGYLGMDLDQDEFVQELDKVLRRAGLLPKRGRVLVVDNDLQLIDSLGVNLRRQRYEVHTARTAEEAIFGIESYRPQVVVVDIRLKNDDDDLDESGYELIEAIVSQYDHALKVIGLTGSPVRKTPVRIAGKVFRFMLKDSRREVNEDELGTNIEAAIEDMGINRSLVIEFDEQLSFSGLVKTIKAYSKLNDEQQAKISEELEELIRKLYSREIRVKGHYLSPGRGGSGVVLMRPTVEGDKGEYFVIKFGARENIATELDNYNTHVKPFAGRYSTQLIDIADRPRETLNLGGLKFNFVGMSREIPRDFNTFYRDPATTERQISVALHALINKTCGSWYTRKRDWMDQSLDSLAKFYEAQFSLDHHDKQLELEGSLLKLLNGKTVHGHSFHPQAHDGIKVQMEEKELVFPNPLLFVKQHRTEFAIPRFQCRTHGDLNGRNMFVDKNPTRVWLIDFFKSGWGPLLRDIAELETVIKFELIETQNLTALYDFEKALDTPSRFAEPIQFIDQFHIKELAKACSVISRLRRLVPPIYESVDMKEYYASLLFYAIRMVTWDGISSMDMERYPIRQRHALLSAAMICHRLQHWGKWMGWADEKKVFHTG